MSQRHTRRTTPTAHWRAGRRAWASVRSSAIVESRAARPRLAELRDEIACGHLATAVDGARKLFELLEPESLREARRLACPGGSPAPGADLAVRHAWEAFRHDRGRAVN